MKQYRKPTIQELGSFETLTTGPGGSFNDGAGGGEGMAGDQSPGMSDM